MKNMLYITKKHILFFICIFLCFKSFSQTPGQDKSILLRVTTQTNPPQITLLWDSLTGVTNYYIYRKSLYASSWGTPIASNLPANTISWTDTNVQVGQSYEYRVVKNGTPTAFGYIYAGIEIPEVFYRGKIILLYDTITTSTLTNEINRWIADVEGDGWEVIKIPVDTNDAVYNIKNQIVTAFYQAQQPIKALFIFGKVPVPYSGEIAPDGHNPDHLGAWPADGYYADINGTWTDQNVNNTLASNPQNHNIPGDGKFDQNNFPSNLEFSVGRVDMRNLPAFNLNETQLLKKYLDKNHAYRNKHFTVIKRALIDDNFTAMPEGFTASAWRSFSTLCGSDNVFATDYFSAMSDSSYQWSYGCGAGGYTSCSGVGNTSNFATDSLNGIFTMLFGSYFGDWNTENNLLRAALANGTILTNCWSGRPFWYFHHMALGEPIGTSVLLSMNNTSSIYEANFFPKGVHMAFLGDPTLRSDMIAPPQNLIATYDNGHAFLSWSPSPEPVLGYHIYRKNDTIPSYQKVNNQLITNLSFVDTCLIYPGIYHYMVRAVKLEYTPSGSYFNMSTGITDTLFNPNYIPVIANFQITQNGNQLIFHNLSQNATNYFWKFGDGNFSTDFEPTHTYANPGTYTVSLIASSACGSDTFSVDIQITTTNVQKTQYDTPIFIYPNPCYGTLFIENISPNSQTKNLHIQDLTGKDIAIYSIPPDAKVHTINLEHLPNGFYIIRSENSSFISKIILQH